MIATSRLAAAVALGLAASGPLAAPLTLDEALELARRGNAELRLAQLDREAAGTDVAASRAAILPRLDLTAGLGHTFVGPQRRIQVIPRLSGGDPAFEQRAVETPAADYGDYGLGLRLQQTIFDGFRSWAQIARARAVDRAAERQVDETALSVAFAVTQRFYELVKAERSLAVLEESVKRSEDNVRRAEALFAAGRSPKGEIFAAQVNLGNDRIAVEGQRARGAAARAELAVTLGVDAGASVEVVAPAALDEPGLPGSADLPVTTALLERAREARPALLRFRELLESARQDERAARAGFWPTVGLSAGYDRSGPELAGRDAVLGNPARQYVASTQLFLQWNLYAGGQTRAAEQRAGVAARSVEVQARRAEQLVAGELERTRHLVAALSRSVAVAADNLKSAEQGVNLAEQRLEAGAATQLEVRDALLKLTQARLTLLSNRIDLVVARADLGRAVGGPP